MAPEPGALQLSPIARAAPGSDLKSAQTVDAFLAPVKKASQVLSGATLEMLLRAITPFPADRQYMNPEPAAPPPVIEHRLDRSSKLKLPRETGILGALVLMLLVLTIFIPQFRAIGNLTNITRNFSFVGIVALGMTLVVLTGELTRRDATEEKVMHLAALGTSESAAA